MDGSDSSLYAAEKMGAPMTERLSEEELQRIKGHNRYEPISRLDECKLYVEIDRAREAEAAHVYGGLQAILTKSCELAGVPYIGVPVGTVKKVATGRGFWRGCMRRGREWRGGARPIWSGSHGPDGRGRSRLGLAGQIWHGSARRIAEGTVGCGLAGRVLADLVRWRIASRDTVWPGGVWLGRFSNNNRRRLF